MQTFSVKVCKYANNILFTLKISKNALKKMAAANTVLCLVAYIIGIRVAAPALALVHLVKRDSPQSATTHSPDTL